MAWSLQMSRMCQTNKGTFISERSIHIKNRYLIALISMVKQSDCLKEANPYNDSKQDITRPRPISKMTSQKKRMTLHNYINNHKTLKWSVNKQ